MKKSTITQQNMEETSNTISTSLTDELRADFINRMIRGVTYYSSSPHVVQLSIMLWDSYCAKCPNKSRRDILCAATASVLMATELSGVHSIDVDILTNIVNYPNSYLNEILFFAAAKNQFYNQYMDKSYRNGAEYEKDSDTSSYSIVCYSSNKNSNNRYIQFDPSQYLSKEERDDMQKVVIENIEESDVINMSYEILRTKNMRLFYETPAQHLYRLSLTEEEQRLGVYISLICMIDSTEYKAICSSLLAHKIVELINLCTDRTESGKIREIISEDRVLLWIYSKWINFDLKKNLSLAEYLHYHFGMGIDAVNEKFTCGLNHVLEAMLSVNTRPDRILVSSVEKTSLPYHDIPILTYAEFLKQYTTTNNIGQGTFGSIWEIADSSRSSQIVVKKIYEDRASAYREINAYLELKHPNILEIYGCSVSNNHEYFYLVLEKMETTLSFYLHMEVSKYENITWDDQRSCILQLLSGIEHIHNRNLAHRDLTASNILIKFEEGKPILKIADFGTAKHMVYGETFDSRYNTHQVCGANYRAVEIWIGQAYGKSADIWAVGCLIYLIVERRNLITASGFKSFLINLIKLCGEPVKVSDDICPISTAKVETEHKNSFNTDFSRWYHYNRIDKIVPEEVKNRVSISKLSIMEKTHPKIADVIKKCLHYQPLMRPTAPDLVIAVAHALQ